MSIQTRRERHQTRFRRGVVRSNTRITPTMARIVLHSKDFEGFTSPGFDDHIRLFFPEAGQKLPEPKQGDRGLIWPGEKPQMRDYTPRFFDAETLCLTIDFVVHGTGIASTWAENAVEGDELGIGGPRGSFIVEGDIAWHLLIGDQAALPAIARRIEELPSGSQIRAIIEVPDVSDEQTFASATSPELTWVHTNTGDTLSNHISDIELPQSDGFVFIAGEASMIAHAREKMAELGLPDAHLKAAKYWRKRTDNAQEH